MFTEITSMENFFLAYASLKEKYLETGRYFVIKGIDGISMADFSENAGDNLALVRRETMAGVNLLPLIAMSIPKKSGNGDRVVHHSAIRDRVLYQAVCQVLQPEVEKNLSPYLYSYRQNRSHYHAIKNLRRIFLKKRSQYYILKTDLKDYTDHLDHKVLINQFEGIGCDAKTLELLRRIFTQEILTPEKPVTPEKGVVQGIQPCSLCANLYLADVDFHIPDQYPVFYQRVGDDIIVLGKEKQVLEEILRCLESIFRERKLVFNADKTLLQSMEEPFEYLGFEMADGELRINPAKVRLMKKWFSGKFHRRTFKKPTSKKAKMKALRGYLIRGEFPQNLNWLRYYHLLTDARQLSELDRFVRKRIIMAFTGRDHTKDIHRPESKEVIEFCYKSFSNLYFRISRGRESLENLNTRLRAKAVH